MIWDILLVVCELPTRKYSLRQCFNLWESSLGFIKRMERVKHLSRPSPLPLFVPCGQHTHVLDAHSLENVHSLNAAKQVTMWRDLSHYWVFHWMWTLSFVLLDVIVKSTRCSEKLHIPPPSLPCCSADKRKWSWFFSKIVICNCRDGVNIRWGTYCRANRKLTRLIMSLQLQCLCLRHIFLCHGWFERGSLWFIPQAPGTYLCWAFCHVLVP